MYLFLLAWRDDDVTCDENNIPSLRPRSWDIAQYPAIVNQSNCSILRHKNFIASFHNSCAYGNKKFNLQSSILGGSRVAYTNISYADVFIYCLLYLQYIINIICVQQLCVCVCVCVCVFCAVHCRSALGMQDGRIKDRDITASSQWYETTGPKYARSVCC